MIPLKDNVPSRTTPVVNSVMIAICAGVFLIQSADRSGLITLQYGMVPARISDPGREISVERVVVVRTAVGLQEAVVKTPLPPSPILFFIQILVIPALVFLGLWFVMQLLMGTFSVGNAAAAGVAWWAHVGGFVAGFAATSVLMRKGSTRPAVTVVRPGSDRITSYRLRTRRPPSL